MQLHTYLKRRVLGTLRYLNQILTYQRKHVLSYQINFHISLLPIVKIKSEIGSLIKKDRYTKSVATNLHFIKKEDKQNIQ